MGDKELGIGPPPPATDPNHRDEGPDELETAVEGKEIYNFFGNRVYEHTTSSGRTRVLKVRPRKWMEYSEGELMQCAFAHGILAPRVYGTLGVKTSYTVARVLVSDKVPGRPLVDVWQDLGEADQASIKEQLRQQFSRMRECTQPFIGCPGRQTARNNYNRIIPDRFGPFETEEAFDEWCLNRLKCMPHTRWRWKRWVKNAREKSPSRFVLTHGDLTPRNIMVEGNKVTGIIDWERGGFFPEYCEYAWAMKLSHEIEKWWVPVLQEVLRPCSKERLKFTEMVEDRGW